MAAVFKEQVASEGAALANQGRIDLAAALRWAARLGLNEGVCNHFSLEIAPDRYLINPQGMHWSEVTAADILLIDGRGDVLEGRHPLEPTAFFIHSHIHRANPQAKCILHTHMPYATALTLLEGGRVEMCNQNALRFWNRIAYDDSYNGVALFSGSPLAQNSAVIQNGQYTFWTYEQAYYNPNQLNPSDPNPVIAADNAAKITIINAVGSGIQSTYAVTASGLLLSQMSVQRGSEGTVVF